ncbi:hypothetical protein OZD62_00370 [Wolbachia endosymbiont of Drosophila seguyi]|nr:hypothetical protein [Wolbachia endosymbiont of Drosophila seguyi]MDE5065423.1 hypothetical protein [Wolbachia endosymbiont of Drosophila seguyi]
MGVGGGGRGRVKDEAFCRWLAGGCNLLRRTSVSGAGAGAGASAGA